MPRSTLVVPFALVVGVGLLGCDAAEGVSEIDQPVDASRSSLPGFRQLPANSGIQKVPSRCVATVSPGDGAERVDIVTRPTITWSSAVGRSSAAGRIRLIDLATGDEVPSTQTWLNNRTLQLSPEGSLWFFKSYQVQIDSGISAAGDVPCVSLQSSFSTRDIVEAPGSLRPAGIHSSAAIGSALFGVGREHGNLQVWDFSGVPTLVTEAAVARDPNAIVALGDELYVAVGDEGLILLDTQGVSAPTTLGSLDTPGFALDVVAWTAAGRRYAAIADLDGVRILDTTTPGGIFELGAFGVGDAVPETSLAYADGVLAVGQANDGLRLVDVSSPAAPIELSQPDTGGYPVRDVALSAGVLYVAQSYYGLLSFDVSTPAAPVELGMVHAFDGRDCSVDCIDDLGGLTLDGDTLFASTGRRGALRVALDGAGGMTDEGVLDVAGPGWSTAVIGSRLVVGGEGGPTVFDRTAPAGSAPIWFDPNGHGSARGVHILGGALHVAANSRGLQTYSLDEPLAPFQELRTATAGADLDLGPMFLASTGDTLLLADGRSGVRLFDAADAEAPEALGFVPATDRIAGLRVEGALAVACDDNRGVLVLDVTNPAAPLVQARLGFDPPLSDQCRDVELSGSVAWIAASNSLRVLDLSDPTAPAWMGGAQLVAGEGLGALTRVGNAVFATSIVLPSRARHLLAFDVASPTQPVEQYRSEELAGASGLFGTCDVLFVGGGTAGLSVYDIGDPFAPELEGTAAVTGSAGDLAYGGTTLYAAESLAGVRAFDVGVLP